MSIMSAAQMKTLKEAEEAGFVVDRRTGVVSMPNTTLDAALARRAKLDQDAADREALKAAEAKRARDAAERCHRCGSPAKLGYDSGNENWNQKWWYECAAGCGARGHSFGGSNSWCVVDAEDDAAEQSALEWWNKRAPVVATADGLPQFPARHLRVSSLGQKIQLSLLLDALEPANDYLVIPVNPCVVRP